MDADGLLEGLNADQRAAVTTDAISSNEDEPTIGQRADAAATAAATAPARDSGRAPLRIAFEFKDANAQTQMSIHGDSTYDYKYIVMPLRI